MNRRVSRDRPFDLILVHSYSRFFRDAYLQEFYIRRLAKHGVKLASITQETSDDPMGDMVRKMVALFDEHSSRENSKHTLRAMAENARQGFWNGSRPPYGYRAEAAETRGDKVKKRLVVDAKEAEVVRLIFALCLQGMGVKAIADQLNRKGLHYRDSSLFSTGLVHRILRRDTYTGTHHFNRVQAKTGETKERRDWIAFSVPHLVSADEFERVGALLESRRPKETPPRVVNGPTLLTGLATCAHCGGGMTLRTGKGGRYRYYTCSTCARQGKEACKGQSVPMEELDTLVLDQLARHILAPERLKEVLGRLFTTAANDAAAHKDRAAELRKDMKEAERGLERLYAAIEQGMVDLDDQLRGRITALKERKGECLRLLGMAERRVANGASILTPNRLEAFSRALRDRLENGPIEFRKAYLRMFVSAVEVNKDAGTVRLAGSTRALAAGLEQADAIAAPEVPSFVREWRPGRDSNP